jgi:hypothetical protein
MVSGWFLPHRCRLIWYHRVRLVFVFEIPVLRLQHHPFIGFSVVAFFMSLCQPSPNQITNVDLLLIYTRSFCQSPPRRLFRWITVCSYLCESIFWFTVFSVYPGRVWFVKDVYQYVLILFGFNLVMKMFLPLHVVLLLGVELE